MNLLCPAGIHGAPPIQTEACPSDSILSADVCKCIPGGCPGKPSCPWTLVLMTNGSDIAGDCCPTYRCSGCPKEEVLEDDNCPCAPGAKLDVTGKRCICSDNDKHLVNGKCVCNPLNCELPQLCDKKSVAITTIEGCCKKTICKQCPLDSESTNLEVEELEDHCICLPCKTHCGVNESVIIKKKGSGFPGNCCDLYECQKIDETKGCLIAGKFYNNGEEWSTTDLQTCRCNNGLSLCSNSKPKDLSKPCYMDNKLYKDQESWTKEDGCTACICRNGVEQCISHFCDAKESHIHKNNDSQACIKDSHTYAHLQHWLEKDGCTNCTCLNGIENCTNNLCDQSPNNISECQPLANCNKTCLTGFKINKKGCEICKCNVVKLGQDILGKYNISMSDLIDILEEFKNRRTVTTTSTTTTTTTTSSTTTTAIPEVVKISATANSVNYDDKLEIIKPTTTEPSVIPTGKGADSWIYISLAIIAFACFMIGTGLLCVYKNKRKSSIDLTHCHYETVNNLNNNNTIKKTDQLL